MSKSRKKGIVQYSENPFLEKLHVPVTKKFKNHESGIFMSGTAQQTTGEAVEVAAITRVENVDEEKFVKLYTDELRHFFNLKPSTQRVLQVVLVELQKRKDKDSIYLDYKHSMEYFTKEKNADDKKTSMSRATFHNCVKELIENDFIAESTYQNQYFINPRLFYNGSRLRLVREFRVKKNKEEQQQELPLD